MRTPSHTSAGSPEEDITPSYEDDDSADAEADRCSPLAFSALLCLRLPCVNASRVMSSWMADDVMYDSTDVVDDDIVVVGAKACVGCLLLQSIEGVHHQ